MLSIGEVHNMGLNGRGGFHHHNVYDRGIYGLFEGNGNFNNAGGSLNDFLRSNSYTPQAAIAAAPVTAYPGQTSMGFQSDSFPFDVEVMPQVVDDLFNFPVGIVTTAPMTTATAFAHLQQPPARESWMEPVGGRGVKRECSVQLQEAHELQLQPARKKLDSSLKRPSDQADHILRERQRRDDMTSKFAVLESLLPTALKRDRSTIVDDSIEYVKNLHHRIKLLKKRKEELAPNHRNKLWKSSKPEEVLQSPNTTTTRKPVSPEEMSKILAMPRSSLESMQVHTDMPNQVVIHMVCRPQPRLQSNILKCLESLSLDVMQCSITKVSHRLICIITAKAANIQSCSSCRTLIQSCISLPVHFFTESAVSDPFFEPACASAAGSNDSDERHRRSIEVCHGL